MYLYISSRDSKSLFPDNTKRHFRANLASRISLPNLRYKVALVEYYGIIPPDTYIDINLSVLSDSLVEGSKSSIIRRLYGQSQTRTLYTPANLLYVPVRQLNFDCLEVNITESQASVTSDPDDYCIILLHIAKL